MYRKNGPRVVRSTCGKRRRRGRRFLFSDLVTIIIEEIAGGWGEGKGSGWGGVILV